MHCRCKQTGIQNDSEKKIDDVDEDSDVNQSATLSFFNVERCSFVSFAIVHATLYRCYHCCSSSLWRLFWFLSVIN